MQVSSKRRKALQSGMLKGKHIWREIWLLSSIIFWATGMPQCKMFYPYRLLHVPINSDLDYMEPLGKRYYSLKIKQNSTLQICLLNTKTKWIHIKNNIRHEKECHLIHNFYMFQVLLQTSNSRFDNVFRFMSIITMNWAFCVDISEHKLHHVHR